MFSLSTLLTLSHLLILTHASPTCNMTFTSPSTQLIANIPVPSTPLITKAIAYARSNSNDFVYNHVMRSWLFGEVVANTNPDLAFRDREVHAIAAILHDLGWSNNTEMISKDKRFEVDGAIGARNFLLKEGKREDWDKHRIQLVWDTISLHTTNSIWPYKEVEVQAACLGITMDFMEPEKSPNGVITREIWNNVNKEFPRLDFRDNIKNISTGLCMTKPETTYDNFLKEFGDRFVPGYKAPSFLDMIFNEAPDN